MSIKLTVRLWISVFVVVTRLPARFVKPWLARDIRHPSLTTLHKVVDRRPDRNWHPGWEKFCCDIKVSVFMAECVLFMSVSVLLEMLCYSNTLCYVTYVYIYLYVSVCMYACICMISRERKFATRTLSKNCTRGWASRNGSKMIYNMCLAQSQHHIWSISPIFTQSCSIPPHPKRFLRNGGKDHLIVASHWLWSERHKKFPNINACRFKLLISYQDYWATGRFHLSVRV